MEKKRIDIAVGAIVNAEGLIFITRRQKGSHLAGFWEFPGGKVETTKGESAEQALSRELWKRLAFMSMSQNCLECWSTTTPIAT